MKIAHNPNPIRNKRQKANLFVNDNPEELETARINAANINAHKVMLRLDSRTHVLVSPQNATPEYVEKLKKRYKIGYFSTAKGGRKKI